MPKKPANKHTGDYQHSRMPGALLATNLGKMCAACHDGLHGKLCQGFGCDCPCQRPTVAPVNRPDLPAQATIYELPGVKQHKDE
jgi:hypothetical protein